MNESISVSTKNIQKMIKHVDIKYIDKTINKQPDACTISGMNGGVHSAK